MEDVEEWLHFAQASGNQMIEFETTRGVDDHKLNSRPSEHTHTPVSYTHLDVYKRQTQDGASAQQFESNATLFFKFPY